VTHIAIPRHRARVRPAVLRAAGRLRALFVCHAAAAAALLAACGGARPPAAADVRASATADLGSAGGPSFPAEDDAAIPVGPNDATWGSRTAPVTIVEFSDFQCPFCARVEPTLAQLRGAYGTETLRIVWKNSPLPFHAHARGAAEAAAGVMAVAGRDAFWRFHDAVFAGQRDLGDEDRYVAWAQAAGVGDADAFRAGLRAGAWASRVDADLQVARRVGVDGTPSFFVNGLRLVGAQPLDAFRTVIDAQIQAAKDKIAAGTPAARVYTELSAANLAGGGEAAPDGDDGNGDAKTTYRVPIGNSPVRGEAAAAVTIVEFADYECPYCALAEATLRDLRARYGADLRVVFKDAPLPFHKHADAAAQAALEVRAERGEAAFWAMHDTLFEHQDRLGDDDLVGLAAAAGADAGRVRSAIASHRYAKAIADDEDLADDLGIDGTPQFFINGRHVAGAVPAARFVAVIDAELGKARARIAQGTKPEALYDTIAREGQGPPEPPTKDATLLPAGDPVRGPATAKVTIHEFGDFECPYCVRAEATMKQIEAAYGPRVRFAWHDLPLPFHRHAMQAARAAREVFRQKGDRGFWELHDRLMQAEGKIDRALLDDQARTLGLDDARWRSALDADAGAPQADPGAAAIEADLRAAEALLLSGTPSFVVVAAGARSGTLIVGAVAFTKFRKAIEHALAEAK
jgi:protein-disulfide isomerase